MQGPTLRAGLGFSTYNLTFLEKWSSAFVMDAIYFDSAASKVVADNHRLAEVIDAGIIRDGAKADRVEHNMSLREAFRAHKKAIFWSMALSAALIMEGYDVVVVSPCPSPSRPFSSSFNINDVDCLVLRPGKFREAFRSTISYQCSRICHYRRMAICAGQRLFCWGYHRSFIQRLGRRTIWSQESHVLLPCSIDWFHLHHGLR